MRRIIDVLSILGIITAPVAIGLVYSQSYVPQAAAVTQQAAVSDNFPLNQSRLITFEADEGFQRLSDRQKLDQLRDWLLLTVMSRQGLSAKDINQTVYDLPPIRYGYMSPVANFEYGQTRSLYIGKGQVVALLPKGTSSEERRDDLSHIADRHRKDLGKLPTSLLVFEYEISPDKQFAFVTKQEVFEAKKLFSSAYGYYEAKINSLVDFQQFMNQVDDVTFSQVKDSSLVLGGRKLSSHQYQGIRVEDVAAIWQSEKKIQEQRTQFEARWQEKFNNASPLEQAEIEQQARQELQKLKLVNGSGFSLDPAYDYSALQRLLTEFKPIFKKLTLSNQPPITREDIQQAERGLSRKDEVPYLVLVDKLSKSSDPGIIFLSELASEAGTASRFQAARYDGDLQGTEVGMVLFYTDLLAKLWALNYVGTTPSRNIADLYPLTKIQISSIYQEEMRALPSTRLWFGTQDRGFQSANEGNSLLFARNATRIYAASSNPLNPGVETTAAANTDAFLSWWNDHYEEVARYEPQYERLNQIMKWSLLISWLNQSERGDQLGFLQGVAVKRGNWFSDWIKAQGDHLKFRHWERVGFLKRGYKGTKTEAMPLLESEDYQQFGETRYFRGGVSLADKALFEKRIPLPTKSEISELGKRSNLNYGFVKPQEGKLAFKTLDETEYSFKNLNRNLSEVTAEAKAGTKFRSPDAELANQGVSRRVSQTFSGLEIDTSIGRTELGTLSINKTRNGFTVGFQSLDIDTAHSLGLQLSRDKRPLDIALRDIETVESVLKSTTPPPDYFVKLSDSTHWLKLTEAGGGGGSGPPKPPKDWQFLVGDLGDDSRNFRISWIDDKAKVKQLQESGNVKSVYSRISEGENPKFGDDLRNRKYRQSAEDLVNDSVMFFAQKEKHLKIELKRVDGLLKAGKDTKAAKHLDILIQFYGPEPNLMLRKAIVELPQGKLNVKRIVAKEQGDDLLKSKDNFLDQINGRLGKDDFNVRRIETDKAFIYIQDHPGLNNLDWNVPIEQSVSSGSGARVYQVLPGNIGGVKLHLSGLGDTSASFHASTQFQGSNPANALHHINLGNINRGSGERCNEENKDKANCPQEKPTYIVIMPDNT
jgi:hypothetical protein